MKVVGLKVKLSALAVAVLLLAALAPLSAFAQGYRAYIWTDRSSCKVGEKVTIYFYVSHRCYAVIASFYAEGGRLSYRGVVFEGYVGPGRHSIVRSGGEPAGLRVLVLGMYINGRLVAWNYCTLKVEPRVSQKVLPVPWIRQPGNDCWAASLAMVACYYNGWPRSYGSKVIELIHGLFAVPEGLSGGDLLIFYLGVARVYHEHALFVKYLHFDIRPVGSLAWQDVVSEINSGHPIVAFLSWWDPFAHKKRGHAVVIAGYYERGWDREVYVLDPSGAFSWAGNGGLYQYWAKWDKVKEHLGIQIYLWKIHLRGKYCGLKTWRA